QLVSTLQGGKMMALSADGDSLINGFGGHGIRLWDLSGRGLRLVGHRASITKAALTPDEFRIVTSSFDGTARVWNPLNGDALHVFDNHFVEGAVFNAAFFWSFPPDSELVATGGGDGWVRIWNTRTGEEMQAFESSASAMFSPDGSKLAMIGWERAVIMDWETGEFLLDFDPGFPGFCFILRMAWSPDGRYLIVPCPEHSQLIVWDTETGERLQTIAQGTTGTADWSPDGSRVISDDGTGAVNVYDAETFELLYSFQGHTAATYDVAFSPNGQLVASGDDSGMVRVWDIATGQEVNSFNVGFGVLEVTWAPDGTQLFTAGFSPIPDIRPAWQTIEDLIAYAKECCVFRELTSEERMQFGLQPSN
ncbi:MAG: WD40 repeat domain-containing protein, partial [Anaerolineales bacterium]